MTKAHCKGAGGFPLDYDATPARRGRRMLWALTAIAICVVPISTFTHRVVLTLLEHQHSNRFSVSPTFVAVSGTISAGSSYETATDTESPWPAMMSSIANNQGRTLVYLHRRQSDPGSTRLVAIERYASLGGAYGLSDLRAQVVDITSLRQPGFAIRAACTYAVQFPFNSSYQIFFGQSDSLDDSHFTIAYAVGDGAGTIDGWLRSDDSIELRIRDGSTPGVQIVKR
jgi:hypothetical protein